MGSLAVLRPSDPATSGPAVGFLIGPVATVQSGGLHSTVQLAPGGLRSPAVPPSCHHRAPTTIQGISR